MIVGTSASSLYNSGAAGGLIWRFLGKVHGGQLIRQFNTAVGEQIRLDIAPYLGWEITLLHAPGGVGTATPPKGYVGVSEGALAQTGSQRVTYAATYAAGTYAVPGGASAVISPIGVAGFTWSSSHWDGNAANVVSMPDPLVAATEASVKGDRFTLPAPADLLWIVFP
jgi:hypothetical protein